MNLRRWWEAHFFILEFVLAVVIGLGFVVWSEAFDKRQFLFMLTLDNRESIYGTLASLFGSMLGFSITAVSIVLGYVANDKMAIVRKSKKYNELWEVFKSAIRILGASTIMALFGLFFDKSGTTNLLIFYVNIVFSVLSLFRVARCVWVLENIIAIVTRDIQ